MGGKKALELLQIIHVPSASFPMAWLLAGARLAAAPAPAPALDPDARAPPRRAPLAQV